MTKRVEWLYVQEEFRGDMQRTFEHVLLEEENHITGSEVIHAPN